jgi:hypothetical protein
MNRSPFAASGLGAAQAFPLCGTRAEAVPVMDRIGFIYHGCIPTCGAMRGRYAFFDEDPLALHIGRLTGPTGKTEGNENEEKRNANGLFHISLWYFTYKHRWFG